MDNSDRRHIVKLKRRESWWFYTIRDLNMFFYRYWLFMLLLFVALITLWFIFCFPCLKSNGKCNENREISQSIDRIHKALENCCDCPDEQENINVPDTSARPCNSSETMQGGQGEFLKDYYLGSDPGTVHITYDMAHIPDKLEVFYNRKIVATTTDLVSEYGALEFYYPAKPNEPQFCTIKVSAPQARTVWQFFISCPE